MRHVLFALFLVMISNTLLAQTDEYLKEVVTSFDFRTNCLDVNKDNTRLLIGGENETVTVVDLATKKTVFETVAHYQPVVEVRFSTQHDGFYTVGDRSFKLWLNGAEKAEKVFTGSHTSITDWDLTPEEDLFVGGAYEKKFRVWDAIALTTPQTIETTQSKNVISIAVSTNGKLIACGSLDHTIELWTGDSLTQLRTFEAHAEPVCCLDFVSNDSQLISASHDGFAKLWEVKTGKLLRQYGGHTKAINAIAISPNGRYLLTASYDHTIGLYAIATGERIYRYTQHEAPVLDVKWTSTGDEFYACDKVGQITRWAVPKKVFVDFYFGADINRDVKANPLFQPRRKGESKADYKEREAQAEACHQELIASYYQKYLEMLKTQ